MIIFGGTGFIGRHLACYILEHQLYDRVVAVDLQPLDTSMCSERMSGLLESPRWKYFHADVRARLDVPYDGQLDLVVNLAAVHREPGHQPIEYYETNLLGAEQVCDFAEREHCQTVVFTSSISPYGPDEAVRDESSVPTPATPYGGSKLAAEKIHQTWQAKDPARRLLIMRPGVVFGPGEGGNVSRLIKAVLGNYLVYMGNRGTRKAGSYVKELCRAVFWMMKYQQENGQQVIVFNMSMNPGPSIQEYVEEVCRVGGVSRWIPSVPYTLVLSASHVIHLVAQTLGLRKNPIHPVRIKKLVRSNNIVPKVLVDAGYQYHYDLPGALEDWRREMPSEW